MVFLKKLNSYIIKKEFIKEISYPSVKYFYDNYEKIFNLHPRNFFFVDFPENQTKMKLESEERLRMSKENLNILINNNFYDYSNNEGIYVLKQKINNKIYSSFICNIKGEQTNLKKLQFSEEINEYFVNFLYKRLKYIEHNIGIINVSLKLSDPLKEILNSVDSPLMNFDLNDRNYELFKLNNEVSDFVSNEFNSVNKLYMLDGNHILNSIMKYNNEVLLSNNQKNWINPIISIHDENNYEIGEFKRLIKYDRILDDYSVIIKKASKFFNIKKLNYIENPKKYSEFLIYLDNWYIFELKNEYLDKTENLNNLPYQILEKYLFNKILKWNSKDDYLDMKNDINILSEEIENLVNSKKYKLGIITKKVNHIDINNAREKKIIFPMKSFFTYPKIPQGIFFKGLN